MGLFLVPCPSHLSMSFLFYFFGSSCPILTLCIIVFTSLFTYVAIYVVARKKMKRNDVHSNSDLESYRKFMAFLRELKMAKTYVLVVSLCFFCYLPTVVVFGIIFANIVNNADKTLDSVVNAFDWTDTLASMNSTLNCLIFFLGKQRIEKRRF